MRVDPQLARLCEATPQPPPATLVVAAHPDDETIGAAARLLRLGGACWVVHVTDGAPGDRRFFPASMATATRAAYARVRREEAIRALALAGIDPSRLSCLGVRDQEAVFDMPFIAARIRDKIEELEPEIVLTHAYEGGHPDHDATAFGVQAAASLLERRGRKTAVVEMTGYHDRGGATFRGEFLPRPDAPEIGLDLSDDERRHKRAMFGAFATQREVLSAFKHETERFRMAPRYDFALPPHDGRLHYERFNLGVPGSTWRAFARAALKKLDLAAPGSSTRRRGGSKR